MLNKPLKILIVTDSSANPRSFPASEIVHLEETYPYLLRKDFPEAVFWQLTHGSIPIQGLLSQPMAFLTHWDPDIIIVHAGMHDCQPITFTDFQKEIIKRMTWRFYGRILKYINHPRLIRCRRLCRVSKSSFRKTIRQFKMVFPKAKICWLEICADDAVDKNCPEFSNKMEEYNHLLQEVYKDDLIRIKQDLTKEGGFNCQDHIHLNKKGHLTVGRKLMDAIQFHLCLKKS